MHAGSSSSPTRSTSFDTSRVQKSTSLILRRCQMRGRSRPGGAYRTPRGTGPPNGPVFAVQPAIERRPDLALECAVARRGGAEFSGTSIPGISGRVREWPAGGQAELKGWRTWVLMSRRPELLGKDLRGGGRGGFHKA